MTTKAETNNDAIATMAWITFVTLFLAVCTWAIVAVWCSKISDNQATFEKKLDTLLNRKVDALFEELERTRTHYGNILTSLRGVLQGKFRRIERIIRNESVACGLNGAYGESDPCIY
jgi:hypothetical protein